MEDFNAAVRAAMQLDGKLYKAIQMSYLQEQFEGNGDDIDRHAYGLIAAVNAIYNLGHAEGFKAGADYERQQAQKRTCDMATGQEGKEA